MTPHTSRCPPLPWPSRLALTIILTLACGACVSLDARSPPSGDPPEAPRVEVHAADRGVVASGDTRASTGAGAPGKTSAGAPGKASAGADADARTVLPVPRKAPLHSSERAFEQGIKSYDDGAYRAAARQLQRALDGGLTPASERAQAHKYLAFIHCVSGREVKCRDEFRKALRAVPSFDLTAAEADHPMWGPVFRAVRTTPLSALAGAIEV